MKKPSGAYRGLDTTEAQTTFIQRYNAVLDETDDVSQAEQVAWETIYEQYDEDDNGVWSKPKVVA